MNSLYCSCDRSSVSLIPCLPSLGF
jgi:hypothetical protein